MQGTIDWNNFLAVRHFFYNQMHLYTDLKGQCHEIFACWFFHQIAPPGPLEGTLGRFQFLPKIRGDIQI